MILVDTSIWIDHFHRSDATLVALLDSSLVAAHPMVIGELAVGSLANREDVLLSLGGLPSLSVPGFEEILGMIEARKLHGRGLGLIDVYLLASALLAPGTKLWTRDKRLSDAASRLNLEYRK